MFKVYFFSPSFQWNFRNIFRVYFIEISFVNFNGRNTEKKKELRYIRLNNFASSYVYSNCSSTTETDELFIWKLLRYTRWFSIIVFRKTFKKVSLLISILLLFRFIYFLFFHLFQSFESIYEFSVQKFRFVFHWCKKVFFLTYFEVISLLKWVKFHLNICLKLFDFLICIFELCTS